jgi:hypothetical protein
VEPGFRSIPIAEIDFFDEAVLEKERTDGRKKVGGVSGRKSD